MRALVIHLRTRHTDQKDELLSRALENNEVRKNLAHELYGSLTSKQLLRRLENENSKTESILIYLFVCLGGERTDFGGN